MSHDAKIDASHLTGVTETLLPVLYARVHESRQPEGIIRDPVAEDWVQRIDYDFSRFEDSIINHFGVAVRTEILDDYVRDIIAAHPDCTVINIAAGLDTRFYRMDNGSIHWYELDLPPVIALRRRLMTETDRHRCLPGSALDFTWADQITHAGTVLFIVEGLLMYFDESQVKHLLTEIVQHFPGATMLLEVIGVSQANRTHLNDAISRTDAEFRWGIRDVTTMADWHPCLRYISDVSIYDRHEARWLALPIDWRDEPAAFRNAVDRIVKLTVTADCTG